eukprot:TRINITY_DN13539_c0_g2_i1.p1 TRINITY_DN13539_c0_g2~~TRINITY_DN13539_c0_g2_i1.p1  ORF type:complete len:231 (+),score=30.00 TRINITY_DN13539_c0_g2_i1:1252-1944(+)
MAKMNEEFGYLNKDMQSLNRTALRIQHWYFEKLANMKLDEERHLYPRIVKVLGRGWIEHNKSKGNNTIHVSSKTIHEAQKQANNSQDNLNNSHLKKPRQPKENTKKAEYDHNKKLHKVLLKPKISSTEFNKKKQNVSTTSKQLCIEIAKNKKIAYRRYKKYKGRQDKLNLIGEIAIKTCGGCSSRQKLIHNKQESRERKKRQKKVGSKPMYSALIPVSYTHLTLPTICSV